MDHKEIIDRLEHNKNIFRSHFEGLQREEYRWKPQPEKWCLLEIVCHLYDEEREDFRARLRHVLETPEIQFTKIDPLEWVSSRKYMEQDYDGMVLKFLAERDQSVAWLRSLDHPNWKTIHVHPKVGPFPAELLLANWLAHDYLHFRQITFTKYQYLVNHFQTKYDYAGTW